METKTESLVVELKNGPFSADSAMPLVKDRGSEKAKPRKEIRDAIIKESLEKRQTKKEKFPNFREIRLP